LSLNGLTTLSAESAAVLARHKGSLTLDGLSDLRPDVAKPFSACTASLSLQGLKTLSPETAEVLAERTVYTDLSGLKEVGPNVAKNLVSSAGGLALNGLETLTPEVANELAQCQCQLNLNGLRELTPALARSLSTYRGGGLGLDGIGNITVDDAKSLATVPGRLSLGGLETVSPEVAEVFSDRKDQLSLNGLKRVDRYTFELLNRKRALPYYITVDNANSRCVMWEQKGETPVVELLHTLSEQIGVPVTIDDKLLEKLSISLQQTTASPPRRVMEDSKAVAWLTQELFKDKVPMLKTAWSNTEVRVYESQEDSGPGKKRDPPAAAPAR
jgi:hypothetical protein